MAPKGCGGTSSVSPGRSLGAPRHQPSFAPRMGWLPCFTDSAHYRGDDPVEGKTSVRLTKRHRRAFRSGRGFLTSTGAFGKYSRDIPDHRAVRRHRKTALLLDQTVSQVRRKQHVESFGDAIPHQHPLELRLFTAAGQDRPRKQDVGSSSAPAESIYLERFAVFRRHLPRSDKEFIGSIGRPVRLCGRSRRHHKRHKRGQEQHERSQPLRRRGFRQLEHIASKRMAHCLGFSAVGASRPWATYR